MVVAVFAACIVMTGGGYGNYNWGNYLQSARAYNVSPESFGFIMIYDHCIHQNCGIRQKHKTVVYCNSIVYYDDILFYILY